MKSSGCSDTESGSIYPELTLMSMYNNEPAVAPAAQQRVKGATKRSTRVYYIATAVAVILVAGVLYVGSSSIGGSQVYVLKTTRAISALAPITSADLKVVTVPKTAVEGGLPTTAQLTADASLPVAQRTAFKNRAFVGSTNQRILAAEATYLSQARARVAIPSGVQLRGDYITYDTAVGADLQPDERLISVQSKVGAAVAGQLRPGDYVDVVAASSTDKTATLVVSDVEIIAVALDENSLASAAQRQLNGTSTSGTSTSGDITPSDVLPGDPIPGTYVLKVNLADATKLALYDSQDSLYLLYRPANAASTDTATTGGDGSTAGAGAASTTTSTTSPNQAQFVQ